MCRGVTCKTGQKTTRAGCGQHVDQVMKNVPRSQRCEGHVKEKVTGGFFARMFAWPLDQRALTG
ncbi:hypothetical protein [Cryobacterium sp. M91]|uniref:hypothetical protein n=1 Tax=Cryobacterium sp. M91 TaxID=2048294 RepID=UPI000CE4E787|nr:hypothetical protein [Cryobacterium sp. M91]